MNRKFYRRIFEAAISWLYDVLDSLERKPYDDVLAHEYNACLADVRRMFLAPEEDYADRILKNASPGYTPTHAELDKIWDHIFRAGHGWTPPELRNRGDEFGEKMNDLTVEVNRVGGVVEAAKILRDKDNNPDPIIETLNRRMAEYSDWFHKNLQNLFDKKPFEPRLDWDKPGRKVFTYGDVVKK
jgi:hypothetical protein